MTTATVLDEKTAPRTQISPKPGFQPPSNMVPRSLASSEKARDDISAPPYSGNHPDQSASSPSSSSPFAGTKHLPAFSSSSSRSFPVRSLYIEMKGNRARPWPFGNNHSLETPIRDSTRSQVLYTSTRLKSYSGSCVLRDAAGKQPQWEVGTKYGLHNPLIRIKEKQADGAEKEVEIRVKKKGILSRTTYFVLPEEISGTGGYFEWGYARVHDKGQGSSKHHDNHQAVGEKTPQNQTSTLVPPEIENAGQSKSNESKEPQEVEELDLKLKDRILRGPSRMLLFKHPSNPLGNDHSTSSQNGEYSQKLDQKVPASSMKPIKVAEFVRADDDGKEIGNGAWGPAGQGGWLKIWEDNVLPDSLVISTCLVMLQQERDRRAWHMA